MQQAQPMNQNGALDQQLTQLAIQVLQGSRGGGAMNAGGFPNQGNAGGFPNPANGNFSQQGVQNRNGAAPVQMGGGGGGAYAQLAALYQQNGGSGNSSLRPETHQLVQMALSSGGATGAAGGANPMSQLAAQMGLPGLGNAGGGFSMQFNVSPNFGGMGAGFPSFR
jgi:hypothetical protein